METAIDTQDQRGVRKAQTRSPTPQALVARAQSAVALAQGVPVVTRRVLALMQSSFGPSASLWVLAQPLGPRASLWVLTRSLCGPSAEFWL